MQPCWRGVGAACTGLSQKEVSRWQDQFWLLVSIHSCSWIACNCSWFVYIPALLLPCTGTTKPVVLYSIGIIDRTLSNPCYPFPTIFSPCQSGCRLVCLGGSYEILPFFRWRTKTTWCRAEGFESRVNCVRLSPIVHLGRDCTSCIIPGDFLIQFSGRLSEEQPRTYHMDSVCSK